MSDILLAEDGAHFSATIQRTEDGPQASYLVVGDEGDWTKTQSDMRLFDTDAAALDWLNAEAARVHSIPVRTPMTKVGVSRLDTAGRKLAFGVRHFLKGEDPLLSAAYDAYSVLRDLLEESSGIRLTFDKLLHTSDKLGREFKEVPEALKHADRHPEDIPPTDFYKLAYFTLACGIELWKAHGKEENDDMRSFWNLDNPLKPKRKANVALRYVEQYKPSNAPLSNVEKTALEIAVLSKSS